MQDAEKIQQQIDHMTTHHEAKVIVAQEQMVIVQKNKRAAEEELAKFRVLREGLNLSVGIINQQFNQVRAQENPNPLSIIGFDGALVHMQGLIKQTEAAIAKNEGAYVAFQTMETQFQQQTEQSTARIRGLDVQGATAVELASRVVPETHRAPSTNLEDLLGGLDDISAQEPISTPHKTVPQKKGRRKKNR